MGRILLAAIAWGVLGMIALPALVYVAILSLSSAFDPHCAAAGGNPGCATGALGIALAAAMPAFALFFLFGVIAGRHRLRRRTARDFVAILDESGGDVPSSERPEGNA